MEVAECVGQLEWRSLSSANISWELKLTGARTDLGEIRGDSVGSSQRTKDSFLTHWEKQNNQFLTHFLLFHLIFNYKQTHYRQENFKAAKVNKISQQIDFYLIGEHSRVIP